MGKIAHLVTSNLQVFQYRDHAIRAGSFSSIYNVCIENIAMGKIPRSQPRSRSCGLDSYFIYFNHKSLSIAAS